jgi:phospholipid-binding lipoprotein MlaA
VTTGSRRIVGRLKALACAFSLVLASGCATVPPGEVNDPFEGFNRAMFGFNEGFDQVIARPVSTAYREVVPVQIRERVRNFFANIGDLFIGINNLLQAKPLEASTDFARLAFNSTFGLLGIHDVATEMGLEKHNEDFGQTFGRWGAAEGPYLIWPILGSNTLRDSIGTVLDLYFDPVVRHNVVREHNSMIVLRAVQQRADLLDASRILEEAALDKYVFQRDAYLQRRRSLVNDGNPPRVERAPARAAEAAPEVTPAQAVAAGQGSSDAPAR